MQKTVISSLWDEICQGFQFALYLSKNRKAKL